MDEHDWLPERFEAHRAHLRAVAYRMLGSGAQADDAVQETWLRLRHWEVPPVARIDSVLCARSGRSLTPQEGQRYVPERPYEQTCR